jgi:two-component system response regulator
MMINLIKEIIMRQTVLIIDDSQDDILITKRILSKVSPQTRVEAVLSGKAGLEFLRDGKALPALILLDLKMPGMSGFDTLREIRSDEKLKKIPVIVVTSSALESDMKEAYASGADNFLHKAFNIEQFSEDIKNALEFWLKK